MLKCSISGPLKAKILAYAYINNISNPLNQAFLSVVCLFQVNDEGYTPLMEAAREGHEEMVALLLAQGIHIKMFLLQSVSPVKRHWNGGLGRLAVNCFCLWWCRC